MKSVWLRMWENIKEFIKSLYHSFHSNHSYLFLGKVFDAGLNMVSDPDDSILAAIGKSLPCPCLSLLGFGDWRASTALITGLSAKEAVVSTMAVP